jgi:hypothetical protein
MPDYLVIVQRVIEVTYAVKADNAQAARAQATTSLEALFPLSMDGSRRYTRTLEVQPCIWTPPPPEPHLRLVEGRR